MTSYRMDRFMNNPVTMNRYTYANNNPVGYVDPSGHFVNLTKELVCEYITNTLIYSNPHLHEFVFGPGYDSIRGMEIRYDIK